MPRGAGVRPREEAGRVRTHLVAGLALLLSASAASARAAARPARPAGDLAGGLCGGLPFRGGLWLFECGYLDLGGPALSEPPSRPAEPSSSFDPAPRAPRARAALSRFALLAGRFMGRVDAVSLGGWRLRFKVLLE